jgi:hypothetical protein
MIQMPIDETKACGENLNLRTPLLPQSSGSLESPSSDTIRMFPFGTMLLTPGPGVRRSESDPVGEAESKIMAFSLQRMATTPMVKPLSGTISLMTSPGAKLSKSSVNIATAGVKARRKTHVLQNFIMLLVRMTKVLHGFC